MNLNEYFNMILCLSQKERVDRRFLFDQDRDFKCDYFYSVYGDSPHQSFNLSQLAILKTIQSSGWASCLVFEDDATFRNFDKLPEIMAELPDNWDILYLGANVRPHPDFVVPERINSRIFRVYDAYTTHAIAYRQSAVNWILKLYDGSQMYDSWLSETALKELNAYICTPFLSYQRPTRSDLWDRLVDYTDTFEASEKYLHYL